jgi:hypothetical protein
VLLHAAAAGQLHTIFHWAEPGNKPADEVEGSKDEGATGAADGEVKKDK